MNTALTVSFAIAMVAIVNPIGKVPVWLESCSGASRAVSLRLGALVTGTAMGVLLVALLAGRSVLDVFSLDLASFRVGGGVVIMVIALRMVQGSAVDIDSDAGGSEDEPMEEAQRRFRDVVVPMAVPIIAGPGAITTAIVYSSRAASWAERLWLVPVIGGLTLIVYATLAVSPWVGRYIGETGLSIATRIFGLILAGIAADLIAKGVGDLFPALLAEGSPISEELEAEASGESNSEAAGGGDREAAGTEQETEPGPGPDRE